MVYISKTKHTHLHVLSSTYDYFYKVKIYKVSTELILSTFSFTLTQTTHGMETLLAYTQS